MVNCLGKYLEIFVAKGVSWLMQIMDFGLGIRLGFWGGSCVMASMRKSSKTTGVAWTWKSMSIWLWTAAVKVSHVDLADIPSAVFLRLLHT